VRRAGLTRRSVAGDAGDGRPLHNGTGGQGPEAVDDPTTTGVDQRGGIEFRMRADGKAREIVGISDEVRDLFSSRRRAIIAEVAERVAEYEAKHGYAPSAYTLRLNSEHATLKTRARRPTHEPAREQRLADWEQAVRQRLGMSLEDVLEGVRLEPPAVPEAHAFEPERVIRQAVADVEELRPSGRATTWWRRSSGGCPRSSAA
jgi:TrwC relaxase